MKRECIFTILLSFTIVTVIQANTAKIFILGGIDNDWNNADNWSPAGVPEMNDDVLIPEGVVVDLNEDTSVNSLENFGTMMNVTIFTTHENLNNYGSIIGKEGQVGGLLLLADNLENNGSIGAVGPDGKVTINANGQAVNKGTIMALKKITIETNTFNNKSILRSSGGVKIDAKVWINNEGEISSENGTGGEAGYNDIYITCMNDLGNAMFYNTWSGHVTGGNGAPGYSVGNIYIDADDFRNRGYIKSGEPGDSEDEDGGSIKINSNNFDNAGVIEALRNALAHSDFFSHDPSYNDSPPDLQKQNSRMRKTSSEYFKIEADEIHLYAKALSFSYLGEFTSGTTIIGNNLVDIQSTNDADAVIDFSNNRSAATIISNGSISITGNNIIEPQVGLGYLCNIAPQITAGGAVFEGAAISSLGANNSSGQGGQFEVLVKNQSSSAKNITMTLNSVLGWCDQNFTSTESLEPWEVKAFNVDYLIPAGLNENTIDVVTIYAQLSDVTTISKEVSIYGAPSDVVSVENDINALPESFCLYPNYPNPFNPSTTISFDLPRQSEVTLKVYDLLGHEVDTIISKKLLAGRHEFVWFAEEYSSGVYFYKLIAEQYIESKKFILVK